MKDEIKAGSLIAVVLAIFIYTFIGTGERVDSIKEIAHEAIEERNWEVIRYEGYQYGSWNYHGGKVWYYVKDNKIKNTYYRAFITMWGDELHFHYSDPETLNRVNIDID